MNNSSGGKLDEDNPDDLQQHNQGVRPKVKSNMCVKEAPPGSQNGTTSHSEQLSGFQNGASCSFSVSLSPSSLASSPSSACLSQVPVGRQNGEHCDERCSAKGRTLSAEENELESHDKKRKTGCFVDSESSSGNDGEEGLSDDWCIYTYKGDQCADLPNSFLSVDMVTCRGSEQQRENHRKANHGRGADEQDRNNLGSSPEMDYLEMDFDPGPSLEQDSEEDLNGFERKSSFSSLSELPNEMLMNDKIEEDLKRATADEEVGGSGRELQAGPSDRSQLQCPPKNQMEVSDCNSNSFNRTKGFLGSCCASFCTVENNTDCSIIDKEVKEETLETSVNKVISRTCSISMSERLDKRMSAENNDLSASLNSKGEAGDGKTSFDGVMLWSEQEAISKQMTFASSDISCAATAVINAMLVLKMRISIEEVKQGISTRLKSKSTSIPEYLVSRSYAGFADENLIRGIRHASHGLLFARFFQMYPRRDIVLTKWLSHWMKKGAVPIVTMNAQRSSAPEDSAADVRHHQMIFGVSGKGIYLTNPLECLQEEELWERFVSPSALKIKRSDIVSRWSPDANLKPLMFQSDERWKEMNVLGQVVNVIREFSDPGEQGKFLTPHILIPASSGITLVIHRHSTSYHELISTEDLPLRSNSASE